MFLWTPLWKKKCGFHQHQNKQGLNVIWVRTPTPPCEINQDQPTSHDFAKTNYESSHGFSKRPWLVEHTMPKAYEVFGDMVWQIFFLIPLAFCIFLCWGTRRREARPTFLWRFVLSKMTKMSGHVLKFSWLITHGVGDRGGKNMYVKNGTNFFDTTAGFF